MVKKERLPKMAPYEYVHSIFGDLSYIEEKSLFHNKQIIH